MGTHIVTIPSNELAHSKRMTWKDLQTVDFEFDSPFQLELAADQVLYIDEIIRVLPKKRLVAFGTWCDKPVVAKLFFDKRDAKQHMEKDVAGIQTLRTNKIPAPALYYQGYSNDKRVYVLLFQRLFDARSLSDIWTERKSFDEILPLFKAIMLELATQHVLGVVQQDLHLNNFLLTKKTIFTLDGGQIKIEPNLLPKKESMENLALFFSQLGVGVEKFQEILFKHYAKARGWLLKPEDITEIFLLIKRWNEARWQKFSTKITRECTQFATTHNWNPLF